MKRIPLPLESYQDPSLPLSAKRLLNLYAERAPSDARSPAALIPTPGLTYQSRVGTGPIKAISGEMVGGAYYVSGPNAYRNAGGVTSFIGTVGEITESITNPLRLMVTIACSPTHVVICVPPRAYWAAHNGMLAEITSPDFGGANSVAYLGGYFVFSQTGTGAQFFVSALNDPTTFDALAFANMSAANNVIQRVLVHRGDLWVIGYAGLEVWYNAGDADFPFRLQSGGYIPYGASTPRSVAQLDNSLFWLNPNGTVLRSDGYAAKRVSTHAIEAITEAANPDDAVAFRYVQKGHSFYALTIAGRTLVYDAATDLWHERSSDAAGRGPWLATAAERVGEGALIGSATGDIYFLDPTSPIEAGVSVPRTMVLPPLWAGGARGTCSRLEIEMEVGGPYSPGTVLLEWSDDGGYTWTGSRGLSMGSELGRRRRVYATRLGSFRQRVFRVTATGLLAVYAVDADISVGADA